MEYKFSINIMEELKKIILALGIKREKASIIPSGGQSIHAQDELEPERFLNQAEKDFQNGGDSALLNSITNSKRAIYCQIDKILSCLGYNAHNIKIKEKMKMLQDLGFVAQKILSKVSLSRNLLEHKYKNPTLEEVEDALDMAVLFIEATNKPLSSFGSEFILGNSDEACFDKRNDNYYDFVNPLYFDFDDHEKCFGVEGFINKNDDPVGKVIINAKQLIYPHIVRLVVNQDRRYKLPKAIDNFFDKLGIE